NGLQRLVMGAEHHRRRLRYHFRPPSFGDQRVAEIFTVENLLALLTLTALEIVLGIDNIVFIAILSGRLPQEKRHRARQVGLAAAMIMRILLLLSITWIMSLTKVLFSILGHGFSGRDLILLVGGVF